MTQYHQVTTSTTFYSLETEEVLVDCQVGVVAIIFIRAVLTVVSEKLSFPASKVFVQHHIMFVEIDKKGQVGLRGFFLNVSQWPMQC